MLGAGYKAAFRLKPVLTKRRDRLVMNETALGVLHLTLRLNIIGCSPQLEIRWNKGPQELHPLELANEGLANAV
jgi:hypothetical protein